MLTGGALGNRFTVRGVFTPFQPPLDLKNLTAQALEQHPSNSENSKKQVEGARYTVSKERQSRIPNVTVFGGYAREIGREGRHRRTEPTYTSVVSANG